VITSFVTRVVTCAAGAALICLSGSFTGAQVRFLVDEPGVWKPWKPFSAIPSARSERAATPADVKAFEATLLQLQAIIRRASGVAAPRGFSVETWGNLSGYRAAGPGSPAGKSLPLAGTLTFGAFPIAEYVRGGKTIREDSGETALQGFHVNVLEPWLIGGQKPVEWGALDTDAFLQPQAKGEVAGIPRFGDIAVLKVNPASLWVPLSLQSALDLVATQRTTELAERRQSAATIQKDFDLWKSAAKRSERAARYKTAAASMPNGAEYLQNMEKQEQELEAALAKEAGPDGSSMKSVRAAEAALGEVTALLGQLSAADLEQPACYATGGTTLRTRFRAAAAAGCAPLGRPNPQFFNASAPRAAAQLIVIGEISRCFDNQPAKPNPWGCTANRQLIETLDKAAVLAMLK
jgi:hypothetical protein